MVEPGGSAVVVPREDAEALGAAIERVAGDPEMARSLGRRGRRIARERFGVETMCAKRQHLFEKLLAAP
jgi:glycosyltransferase involved in cell wall biosynthesis